MLLYLIDVTELRSNIDRKYFPPLISNAYYDLYISVVVYNECADLGLQIPVLTFLGQNPYQTFSSVHNHIPKALSHGYSITFLSLLFFRQLSIRLLPLQPALLPSRLRLPIGRPSPHSGIRPAETNFFNLIASAIT